MFVETKEAGEQQPVEVGTLKLSEAIRIGAAKRPQCRGWWFKDGASCALGAAYEGLTGTTLPGGVTHEVASLMETVPGFTAYYITISAKNDQGETREQIADWLEKKGY